MSIANFISRVPRGRTFSVRMALAYLLLAPLVLNGCGSLLPKAGDERDYFVIDDDSTAPQGAPKAPSVDIVVRDARANRFINSHKIIFSSDPTTRGYYQLAQWVEPPPKRVSSILVSKLERCGAFRSVTNANNATFARFQLNPEVTDYYHDIHDEPGIARVAIDVELVNLENRTLIAKKKFEKAVPVEEYSARGAVSGMNAAANQALNDIVYWAADEAHKLGHSSGLGQASPGALEVSPSEDALDGGE